jgi:hypothetical protein
MRRTAAGWQRRPISARVSREAPSIRTSKVSLKGREQQS